jgi:hypothetical protein
VGGDEGGAELGFWLALRRLGDGGGDKSELAGSINIVSVEVRSTMALLVGLGSAVVGFGAGIAERKYQSWRAHKLMRNLAHTTTPPVDWDILNSLNASV